VAVTVLENLRFIQQINGHEWFGSRALLRWWPVQAVKEDSQVEVIQDTVHLPGLTAVHQVTEANIAVLDLGRDVQPLVAFGEDEIMTDTLNNSPLTIEDAFIG